MEKTKLDMTAFLEAYTAKVQAEEAYRAEVRQGLRRAPAPTTVWAISDRH